MKETHAAITIEGLQELIHSSYLIRFLKEQGPLGNPVNINFIVTERADPSAKLVKLNLKPAAGTPDADSNYRHYFFLNYSQLVSVVLIIIYEGDQCT